MTITTAAEHGVAAERLDRGDFAMQIRQIGISDLSVTAQLSGSPLGRPQSECRLAHWI